MTVEFYASMPGLDSLQPPSQTPDYRERFYYDEMGRLSLYEAVNPNIRLQASPGPQLIARYEYSEDGHTCHRHDTTVFGSVSQWHFRQDALGRPMVDELFIPEKDQPTSMRHYFYDAKGRLEKLKSVHAQIGQSARETCVWTFFIHDDQSFNATSLSPMEMARCQCNLEYLDDDLGTRGGRPVRRISYDSTGTISQSVLLSYDRAGKPVKMELRDKTGQQVEALATVEYERNGLVNIQITGNGNLSDPQLSRLSMMSRSFVVDHWQGWKLLREIHVTKGKQEVARYILSYDQRD